MGTRRGSFRPPDLGLILLLAVFQIGKCQSQLLQAAGDVIFAGPQLVEPPLIPPCLDRVRQGSSRLLFELGGDRVAGYPGDVLGRFDLLVCIHYSRVDVRRPNSLRAENSLTGSVRLRECEYRGGRRGYRRLGIIIYG
jgi:hypothetical protein